MLVEERVETGAPGESGFGLFSPAPCSTVAQMSSGTWSGSFLMRFITSMMQR